MAATLIRDFDLANSGAREQIILGIVDRATEKELDILQAALRRSRRRVDILCGVLKGSGAEMPHEIQLQIIQLLGFTDIYYCASVCRKWRRLFLHSEQLTDDLLKERFPALDDKTTLPDKSKALYQAIRKRHLRDTARFRSRQPNGLFPVDRVEVLQKGRIFRDLTCSASLHGWKPTSTQSQPGAPHLTGTTSNFTRTLPILPRETSDCVVSEVLYSDGRLAWQTTPAPGEWAHPITVHEFRAQRRWDLSLPSMRTKGINLKLFGLGRDLVVARVVRERVLYAWDVRSQAVDRVTLQNAPYKCFTRYRSVVIVTKSGDLLLWSFGHGLTDIDTAMPQNEGSYGGPAKPDQIPRAPLSTFEIHDSKVMFHPRDEDVFYLATFEERNISPDDFLLLWVYEFKSTRCHRIFICRVPRVEFCWAALRADAHGTYHLLNQQVKTDSGGQLSCITFNTLSNSFGHLLFQTPFDTDLDVSFVWNNHLIFRHFATVFSDTRPCPLVANEALRGATENMITSATCAGTVRSPFSPAKPLQAAFDTLEQGTPKNDIARIQDIAQRYPLISDLGAATNLSYTLSFYGGQCNWEGLHVRDCPRSSDPPPLEQHLYPINYFDHNALQQNDSGKSMVVFCDDDFLVVVTNPDLYTVFAVDEDGKIAEAMRDAAMPRVEDVPGSSKTPETLI
ncbi:hypothetical protein J7T55_006223 [Diaporthe amygdali]|uniref:uncharacterized protein n=1 Tax=Phomopsis amygdali TaxID=1214568 RepID=UPI0022FE6D1B|nr:uncharacterized protein J7T55_006223 [Diaporthe amygdali]KAJ0124880.1 hypothetical protein J7T55_006223 [Diaporthe amygdali]